MGYTYGMTNELEATRGVKLLSRPDKYVHYGCFCASSGHNG